MTVATPAELAARLTLARAIAADYARQARGEGQDVRPDWYSWAARLHTALVGILAALEALASGPGITGAPIALADVGTVRAALIDGAAYRQDIGDYSQAGAYRRVSRSLGDDR
jgi:hypothetical protein